MCWYSLHAGGRGAWPRVELVDEQTGKLVLGHKGKSLLKVLHRRGREGGSEGGREEWEGGKEEWERERNVQMYVCVCTCAYVYPTSGVSVGKPQIISVAMVIPGTLQWKECAHVSEPTLLLLVCASEHLVQTCLNTN